MRHSAIVLVIVLLAASLTNAIMFDVPLNSERCVCDGGGDELDVSEEIGIDEVVTGEYKINVAPAQEVDVRLTDPEGVVLHSRKVAIAGKFAFTSSNPGYYGSGLAFSRITMSISSGVAAKDYAEIAKKEQLAPIDAEMKRLEDQVKEIQTRMEYLRGREMSHRDTNESTNSRIMWISVLSLAAVVATAYFQLKHLTNYFRQKKIN